MRMVLTSLHHSPFTTHQKVIDFFPKGVDFFPKGVDFFPKGVDFCSNSLENLGNDYPQRSATDAESVTAQ